MNKLKVMSVFGTRPEAIKMAPLVKALQASEQIESVVCLTGQHREMLDSVMQIFRLTGDYDLHIMEKRQTLSTITTKTLLGMDEVLDTVKHDVCRGAGRVLPSGEGRPRRGGSAHVG